MSTRALRFKRRLFPLLAAATAWIASPAAVAAPIAASMIEPSSPILDFSANAAEPAMELAAPQGDLTLFSLDLSEHVLNRPVDFIPNEAGEAGESLLRTIVAATSWVVMKLDPAADPGR